MARVGVIGLGLVGDAIAERLVHAGFEVVGLDVVAEKNAALAARGGRLAVSAGDVVQQCERIILCLPTSDTVCSLLHSLAVDLSGKTIIDTTTGEPQAMDDIGCEFTRRGAR